MLPNKLNIEQIDTESREQVRRFIEIPYRLYANHPQWVPPLLVDAELYLDRDNHPLYEHSDADFFIVVRDKRDVGRLAVFAPRDDDADEAKFYLFDCENDLEAAQALFTHAFEWASARQLSQVIGPVGFTVLDAQGILVEGFEYPQCMTMTTYNYDYYPPLIEAAGFSKAVDSITCHITRDAFQLPTLVRDIAAWVQRKEDLHIQNFTNLADLLHWGPHLFETQIKSFGFQGISDRESELVINTLKRVANPSLIKGIKHGGDIVGAVFVYPNLSAAFRRAQGQLNLEALQQEMQRTSGVIFNGLAVLPEFQLQGLNALIFTEMEKTLRETDYQYVDLLQIFEHSWSMWNDLTTLGIQPRQRHRVYIRIL